MLHRVKLKLNQPNHVCVPLGYAIRLSKAPPLLTTEKRCQSAPVCNPSARPPPHRKSMLVRYVHDTGQISLMPWEEGDHPQPQRYPSSGARRYPYQQTIMANKIPKVAVTRTAEYGSSSRVADERRRSILQEEAAVRPYTTHQPRLFLSPVP